MRSKETSEELLAQGIQQRRMQIQLPGCTCSLDKIFRKAIADDPRLLAPIKSYQAECGRRGLMCYDYLVYMEYNEEIPENVDEIILADSAWDPYTLMGESAPQSACLVTGDPDTVLQHVTDSMPFQGAAYEGYGGWDASCFAFSDLSDKTVISLHPRPLCEPARLRALHNKAAFAAQNIWRTILGHAVVPDFVKPFLALSYLAQECTYDQAAYQDAIKYPNRFPEDPTCYLAYGPLVEHRGICSGYAWAFKTMMDTAGVECRCIPGILDGEVRAAHMWNLVKMDGLYYHVDATLGAAQEGVFVANLMQPDSVIRADHHWEESRFPVARGVRLGYDYIEDFLAENGNDYLDEGANEKYFFPDAIYD